MKSLGGTIILTAQFQVVHASSTLALSSLGTIPTGLFVVADEPSATTSHPRFDELRLAHRSARHVDVLKHHLAPPAADSARSRVSAATISLNRSTPPTGKELIVELPQPTPEHEWLLQLVGDWTFDSDCSMGPEQPPMKSSGTQSTRSLGSFWILSDMVNEGPDGLPMRSVMTLGFDTKNSRFVGSFVSSCMSHMWPYDGRLDAARKVLTLDSDGPSFENEGSMAKYQDIIEIIEKDHFSLSSQYRNPDGTWTHLMRAEYTRVPAAQ